MIPSLSREEKRERALLDSGDMTEPSEWDAEICSPRRWVPPRGGIRAGQSVQRKG